MKNVAFHICYLYSYTKLLWLFKGFVQITRVNDLKEYLCNVYDDIILITKYINVGLYKCYFCDMPGSQKHKCLYIHTEHIYTYTYKFLSRYNHNRTEYLNTSMCTVMYHHKILLYGPCWYILLCIHVSMRLLH